MRSVTLGMKNQNEVDVWNEEDAEVDLCVNYSKRFIYAPKVQK